MDMHMAAVREAGQNLAALCAVLVMHSCHQLATQVWCCCLVGCAGGLMHAMLHE